MRLLPSRHSPTNDGQHEFKDTAIPPIIATVAQAMLTTPLAPKNLRRPEPEAKKRVATKTRRQGAHGEARVVPRAGW